MEEKLTVGLRRLWLLIQSYISIYSWILIFKVLALSNSQCKPVLEVVDEFEAGDITENEALMDIPLRGMRLKG